MTDLSQMSGAERAAWVRDIIKRVTENREKLDGCGRHDFERKDDPNGVFQYRCKRCGGWVDASDYHWYRTGLLHGKAAAIVEKINAEIARGADRD